MASIECTICMQVMEIVSASKQSDKNKNSQGETAIVSSTSETDLLVQETG